MGTSLGDASENRWKKADTNSLPVIFLDDTKRKLTRSVTSPWHVSPFKYVIGHLYSSIAGLDTLFSHVDRGCPGR